MKIRKFLSILLACMLLGSLLPSAEAIDCAIYDAYAAPASVTAHAAENAGPRSFMTAKADEAAEDGVAFHPYVFTVDENASVSAAVRLQPALMVLTERAAPLTGAAPDDLEGDGTTDHPYLIGTREQLEKFRDIVNGLNGETQNPGACAVLTADIDLEDAAWTPITDYEGFFDGAGHVISGLNVSGGQYAGLFGKISDSGFVEKLGVQGSVSASGDGAYAGGVAAYSEGSITQCWFSGTVSARSAQSGSAYAGGLAGSLSSCDLSNCWSVGPVSAESAGGSAYAGGVAGYLDAEVYACYHAEGNVTAAGADSQKGYSGGVVGDGAVDGGPVFEDLI